MYILCEARPLCQQLRSPNTRIRHAQKARSVPIALLQKEVTVLPNSRPALAVVLRFTAARIASGLTGRLTTSNVASLRLTERDSTKNFRKITEVHQLHLAWRKSAPFVSNFWLKNLLALCRVRTCSMARACLSCVNLACSKHAPCVALLCLPDRERSSRRPLGGSW